MQRDGLKLRLESIEDPFLDPFTGTLHVHLHNMVSHYLLFMFIVPFLLSLYFNIVVIIYVAGGHDGGEPGSLSLEGGGRQSVQETSG